MARTRRTITLSVATRVHVIALLAIANASRDMLVQDAVAWIALTVAAVEARVNI